MARPGIESRTSDLRVGCPTNCATGPALFVCYRKIGYNIDVLRQTACFVVNPIWLLIYLFDCMTIDRASD